MARSLETAVDREVLPIGDPGQGPQPIDRDTDATDACGAGGLVDAQPHDLPPYKKISSSFLHNATRTMCERLGPAYRRLRVCAANSVKIIDIRPLLAALNRTEPGGSWGLKRSKPSPISSKLSSRSTPTPCAGGSGGKS